MQYLVHNLHYIIVITIIIIIVIIQWRSFNSTKQKTTDFLWIFPGRSDEYKLQQDGLIAQINSAQDEDLQNMIVTSGLNYDRYCFFQKNSDGSATTIFQHDKARKALIAKLANSAVGISVTHDNSTFKSIVDSINDYLRNNKTVSDFHLMKDIVDRNCDAKEDEIATQIPIPLYMGLVGTMAGILIGILYLWLSGGITSLLSADGSSGAAGVEALLGGVALAMISSILGIVFTTWGSDTFKNAKSQVEEDKHGFLSWIQAELLPTLSDNVVGAIVKMTGNLENFNKEFAENTGNLGEALARVNESYRLQTKLIDAVNKIQEGKTASANLTLLSKLMESSEQIGQLADYLHNTNDYLNNVRELNNKLDLQETRTRAIEEVGSFFRSELEQIEARKSLVAQSVGKVDDYLQQALEKLKEHTISSLQEFQRSSIKQQDALLQKTEEINRIVDELKHLPEIKKSVGGFEIAIKGQNEKIDKLTQSIEKLANAKSNGITPPPIPQKTPLWQISLVALIALSCTVLAVKSFVKNEDSGQSLEVVQQEPAIPKTVIPVTSTDTTKKNDTTSQTN